MMRFLIDDASFAAMMRNASAIGFDALLSAPYNNHIAMNPRNETHVARFKALVELGNQKRNRVFLRRVALKTEHLPRQARDKHRESAQKGMFSCRPEPSEQSYAG